jgi:lipid A ethanolaminephosphotransferase
MVMKNKLLRLIKAKLPIGLWQLNLLMSVLFVTVFNLYFWQQLNGIVQPTSVNDVLFIASIYVLLVLVVNLTLNLLTSEKTYQAVYALLFIVSAICFYYISQYNIIIDKEMIRNVMETNSSEAKDLIGFNLLFYIFILAVAPILFILKTAIIKQGFWHQIINKLKIIALSFVAIGLTLYISFPSYASLARNHRNLSHLILPTNFIFAGFSYLGEQFKSANLPFSDISEGAIQAELKVQNAKKVTIIVVGETARADRFSINGYSRETNPKLKQRNIINFKHTSSCGTSTATSLPCLFSHLERKSYDHKTGKNSANLLDFFEHVGIDVQWRDNNTGCKGICDRVDYLDLANNQDEVLCADGECYDEILLKGLSEQIEANPNDQVIVLHQKGSHGPAYHLRYPAEFKVFKPTCQTVQLQKCSPQALNNSYDNTILYTDYFIDQTISLLEGLKADTTTSLFYVSDHGESLGENNLYLHGTPYMIAPESQTHVPFFYWTPNQPKNNNQVSLNCMKNQQEQMLSHDNLFHSLLGFMNISSAYYQADLDLFTDCKTNHVASLASNSNTANKP